MGFLSPCTTKSAIYAHVKSWVPELGPSGIRINTVAPGLTITGATIRMPCEQQKQAFIPGALKRNGIPDDITRVIHLMVGELSVQITGTCLSVDGGVATIKSQILCCRLLQAPPL